MKEPRFCGRRSARLKLEDEGAGLAKRGGGETCLMDKTKNCSYDCKGEKMFSPEISGREFRTCRPTVGDGGSRNQ